MSNVLVLAFNRPDKLQRCLNSVRLSNPETLFVAIDGPREGHPTDAANCRKVQETIDAFDWSCEVHQLRRKTNLGCQIAVSEAISWFFDHVSQGIILEDDCVADLSFFRFSEELLERYVDDHRIGVITGDNFQHGHTHGTGSYYFSKHNHCWGWATWKRAWQLFDYSMGDSSSVSDLDVIDRFSCVKGERRYWAKVFSNVRRNRINSWAYRWTYSCWANRLLTATPQSNLVTNIGFDNESTHTHEDEVHCSHQIEPLRFPLLHPAKVNQCHAADAFCATHHFQINRSLFSRARALFTSSGQSR